MLTRCAADRALRTVSEGAKCSDCVTTVGAWSSQQQEHPPCRNGSSRRRSTSKLIHSEVKTSRLTDSFQDIQESRYVTSRCVVLTHQRLTDVLCVAEGIAIFEAIYEKLDSSENRTQTEKIELDLKKEIKKLQRYRDNIKTWAASNEIKDKKPLMDHRRAIEVQMERFKAVEREVKTKQFSKEGLNNAAKTDPKEREKHEMSRWISDMVDELERQIEQAETEAESTSLQAKKGKANSAKAERLAELDTLMERHRWHTKKLEQALRALENGDIDTDRVGAIKEDVQYYVESNQDPDFAEDEAIYDDLNLGEDAPSDEEDDDSGEAGSGPVASAAPPVQPTPKSPEVVKSKPVVTKAKAEPARTSVAAVKPMPAATKTPIKTGATTASQTPEAPQEKDADEAPKKGPAVAAPPVSMLKYASAAATAANAKTRLDTKGPSTAQTLPQQPSAAAPQMQQQPSPPLTPGARADAWQRHAVVTAATESKPSPTLFNAVPTGAPVAVGQSVVAETHAQPTSQPNYHIPACLIDLIPEEHALTEDERDALLDSSMKYCPRDIENDPPNHYVPKEPFPTPPYYPMAPLDLFNHPNCMEKVEIDTLFYIFYYQRGTYQQYLASRELKKQAWRFHKRYLTWFQRHEEPKVITDEYESGTYRYFDFEASWVQRKKNDFKFQYAYLEDDAM